MLQNNDNNRNYTLPGFFSKRKGKSNYRQYVLSHRAIPRCLSNAAASVFAAGAGPVSALGGAGVLVRVAGWLRLCAMCDLTKCPAQSAAHKLSSPHNTAAPIIRASFRALSPQLVGCEPRTPRRSSMAPCGSRIVPPPRVPTSIEGIETDACKWPSGVLFFGGGGYG